MAQDVVLPQMGESIAEGTITTWLKAVGDRVERDEALFEMSTDKVDAEIPSPAEGVLLEIKVEAGSTVEVGTVVAVIGAEGESAGAEDAAPVATDAAEEQTMPAAAAAAEALPPASAADSVEERRRTKSSPLVRKIAAEHGIDVASVPGSGVSGRVTKKDILAFIERGDSVEAQPSTSVPAAPAATAPAVAASVAPASVAPATAPTTSVSVGFSGEVPAAYRGKVMQGDRVETMSGMRSKIAEHMVISKQVSPHVNTVWEIDFSHVDKLRKKYKAMWKERHGVNLTYTSFIMKATADAIKAFPVMNASLNGTEIIYHNSINLGLAVALDWGLIVPVVKGADELNTLGLSRRANDLAERARGKKLDFGEVQDGTFTITNPGVFGPTMVFPIINQPQVAILGIGKVEKKPVIIDDMIAVRTKAFMTLAFDHRLVDGADADQFMKRIKEGIESFDEGELG